MYIDLGRFVKYIDLNDKVERKTEKRLEFFALSIDDWSSASTHSVYIFASIAKCISVNTTSLAFTPLCEDRLDSSRRYLQRVRQNISIFAFLL